MKTIKIRITVAATKDGEWTCSGGSWIKDPEDAQAYAAGSLLEGKKGTGSMPRLIFPRIRRRLSREPLLNYPPNRHP